MKRRRDSIGSARVAVEVDDEPESQQLGASLADLPTHITTDILLRLPVKSILICKCVCRSLKAMISDPHFAKLHFQHSQSGFMIRAKDKKLSGIMYLLERETEKFENDDDDSQFCCCENSIMRPECNCHFILEHKVKLPFRGAKLVWGNRDESKKRGRPTGRENHYFNFEGEDGKFAVVNSCNGLICLCDRERDYFVVCNPITGEFIRLPQTSRIGKTNKFSIQEIYAGFGFQPKNNEYKVVRILRGLQFYHGIMAAEVHTLGTSTWRNVEVNSMYFYNLRFPTCVSGALHWIGSYHGTLSILCFDFESERFRSFPTPPCLYQSCTESITMGELRGSLYICDSFSKGTPFVMWIMKEYGFKESWTKIFSFDTMSSYRWPFGGLYWPVKHFKNGSAILMYHSYNFFIYYEPGKDGFKIFKVRGTQSRFDVIPHIPSFISLKDVVKGDNIEVLNVHSRYEEFKFMEENADLFLAKVNDKVGILYTISTDDEE
ncbi:F-box/kelch-repeat protein At3g06240-like [Lotus japonicus]|uniref:F-box/kelch-repeat protein At3g06240-like n=1 Tax=Lotus japonicus TaxID=34305 RepID=UPI00258F7456|nr:F-box/kelch-repeat protein At3g06240-like [Lotus japonicus]XP_057441259.1 F-box/kelch-repeat protein At3g06240-like [Lotus japonicus]XP_057441260.1 F-box/kelch-repeat protein At3g06240-like [Lotus japonicus]XP_057441261.1 F-box/kelch-repeat protein At3g06240-like [Lotus japonicus]